MFDDDDVTMVKSEDILKLSGGGKGPQGRLKVALIFFLTAYMLARAAHWGKVLSAQTMRYSLHAIKGNHIVSLLVSQYV